MNNFSERTNFIWNVANLIRDSFKRGKYQDVILPFTVLRRVDAVLAPTKDDVVAWDARLEKMEVERKGDKLRAVAGHAFYNTSPYDFERLLHDPQNLAHNLKQYINSFSRNMRELLEKFDFYNTIDKLEEARLLYLVVERFAQVDLHPDEVSNTEMGYIFEELIRRFNEALNENPGEHFTPREVIRLMVRLLLAGDDRDKLQKPGVILKVYDPAAGSGGMLTAAKGEIGRLNPQAEVHLYGQEVNPETYAVCKADMLMKSPDGRDAENIKFGSTLSDDQLSHERFDYLLSNPPYGKDWRRDKKAVEAEAKRGGRFHAGTPRISDGQLLFLQHMLSRMLPPQDDGGRVAIVMNGSPLFTGDAGSGESEIRRWILEHDWLECIVALPDQLFYNTGINTYVWVLSNHKPAHRQERVQLIDATDLYQKMRKSLGDKRHELGAEHIAEIARLYTEFAESDRSKLFEREQFGYRKIRVERPLRRNFQATAERIERLWEQRAFQKLAQSRKRDPEKKQAEIEAGQEKQQAIIDMLHDIPPTRYTDIREFRPMLKQAAKNRNIKLYASMRDAIHDALGEKDAEAEIEYDRQGRPVADSDLRDYENVPLDEDVYDYFDREVMPYVPDAWVDEDYTDEKDGGVGRVGYEINFNRYFYEYEPPRPLEEIEAEIAALEQEILAMLGEVTA